MDTKEKKVLDIGVIDVYFKALSEKKVDVLNEILAADAVKHLPYAPKCIQKELIGPQAIMDSYQKMFSHYDSVEITHKEIHSTDIPGVYFVKYTGTFTKKDVPPYANHYAIMIKIQNNVIVSYDEYFDTELAAQGCGCEI